MNIISLSDSLEHMSHALQIEKSYFLHHGHVIPSARAHDLRLLRLKNNIFVGSVTARLRYGGSLTTALLKISARVGEMFFLN